MARRSQLLKVGGAAILAAEAHFVHLPESLGTVAGAVLVFYCPGAATMLALESPDSPVRGARRLVLTVATSMGLVAVGGLVLNFVASLTGATWTLGLLGFTSMFVLVAAFRSSRACEPHLGPRRRVSAMPFSAPVVAGLVLLVASGGALGIFVLRAARQSFNRPIVRVSVAPVGRAGAAALTAANLTRMPKKVTLYVEAARGRWSETIVLPADHSATAVLRSRSAPFVAAIARLGQKTPLDMVVWDPARANVHGPSISSMTVREDAAIRRWVSASVGATTSSSRGSGSRPAAVARLRRVPPILASPLINGDGGGR